MSDEFGEDFKILRRLRDTTSKHILAVARNTVQTKTSPCSLSLLFEILMFLAIGKNSYYAAYINLCRYPTDNGLFLVVSENMIASFIPRAFHCLIPRDQVVEVENKDSGWAI